MERYIEFEGNITKNLTLESLTKSILKISGIENVEKDLIPEGLNLDIGKGKASVRVKGNFDPSKVYSIINDAGYRITKIGHQRFN